MSEQGNAPRIVAATGSATHSRGATAQQIEAAMSQAVLDCAEEGITDTAEIKARMLEARERVKAEAKAQAETAADVTT